MIQGLIIPLLAVSPMSLVETWTRSSIVNENISMSSKMAKTILAAEILRVSLPSLFSFRG